MPDASNSANTSVTPDPGSPFSPTGSPDYGPGVPNLNSSGTNSSGLSDSSFSLPFAIRAENTLALNNGGDFDGIPLDPGDDALIYAGRGFTLNNSAVFPIQRDSFGDPLRDSNNRLLLIDRAVTVSSSYTTLNVSSSLTNQYATLNPPQVVPTEIVNVPTYATLKQEDLDYRVPSGTPTVTFNSGSNPINSDADWYSKFPAPGTTTHPTVVQVIGGGLSIPSNVNLSNTVITVENGDINFNGSGHTFNNVVLITNNGNINLSNVNATNLSVLAANSINMNSGARFGGFSLLATGASSSNITFNGASATTTSNSNLRVISQGNIAFNAPTDTRGEFLSARNFSFNSTHTLYGSIGAKNNVIFNNNGAVIYNGISQPSTNQAPKDIVLSGNGVPENSSTGTSIGIATTTDPDANDTHTYTLLDNAGGRFQLNGDQLQVADGTLLDFEANSSHTISVQSTDAGGLSVTRSFTITIMNVNEAPIAITLNGDTVAEAAADGTVIGTFITTDPDVGDSYIYTLIDNAGGRFAIFNGNQLVVVNGALLDFETRTSHAIRIRTTDQGGLSLQQDLLITLTDINEAPTALLLDNTTLPENVLPVTTIGLFTTVDQDSNDTHTYSLVTGAGDPDIGIFEIVGNELRLNPSPDFEDRASYPVRVKTTDQAGLSYTQDFTITIVNVNEAPSFTSSSNISVNERETYRYSITTTDPDIGDTRLIAAPTLPTWLTFIDNGDGTASLSGTPTSAEIGAHPIELQVTDAGGLSAIQTFILTVFNVNDAPTDLTLAPASLAENVSAGSVVGFFSTTDPDASDSHTYSLTPGAGDDDNAAFSIVGNQLQINRSSDFETQASYSIRVRTADQAGLFLDQQLTIQVTNVNEAPSFSSNALTTATAGESYRYDVTTIDPDIGDIRTISAPTLPAWLTLANTGIGRATLSANPTNAEVGTYEINLIVTDADGLTATQQFTLTVSANNSAPTGLILTPTATPENVAASSVIGLFSTTDPDGGDSHTYSLVPGNGDADNAEFTVLGNQLQINTSPDFEAKASYSIRVRSTDESGAFYDRAITITITDVNEFPVSLALSSATIAENAAVNTLVGTISTIDPDANNTHTYTLVDDADERFTLINGNQLVVANGTRLDFEADSTHSIRIRTTDQGGLSYEQNFKISLSNVNEAPEFISTPVGNASSDTPYQYNIVVTDPDSRDTLTLSASDLPPWLTFTSTGNGTGIISGTPNVGQSGLYSILLTATDAGGLSTTQPLLLSVDTLLQEGSDFTVSRSTSFTISSTPSVLQFTINPLIFDQADSDQINDAFEVALLDAQGKALTHTISTQRDAFFNWTEDQGVAQAAGVSYEVATKTVTLNLTGITPGTLAILVFRLVNNDQDATTSVRLQDLVVLDAPFGTEPAIQSPISTLQPSTYSGLFSLLSDVTPSIQAEYQRTSFNTNSNLLYAEVGLRNIGSYGLNHTVLVIVDHISDPNILVRNPDGFTPEGAAYYNFSHLLADGNLDPGELSNSRSLIFHNPNQIQFDYDLTILAELNQDPVIESTPSIGVISGQLYRYDVNATDANQDALTYLLLSAPAGMVVNAETGLIEWATSSINVGNHSITVEVNDGRGGITRQPYTVAVINTPSNRPPVFTSNPVVDAYINQLYQYDANAVDPDQDPLNYRIVIGPDGMTINSSTGLLEWTPPPTLLLGDTILGRIGIPGESDEFTLSGAAGQTLYFDPLQYSGNVADWSIKFIAPSGRQIATSNLGFQDNRLITLDETGNYRLIVDLQGERTGIYGFRLINPSLIPITPFDTLIEGRLSPGTEDNLYRFTGATGQKLYIDQLTRSGNSDWTLYDARRQVVASSASMGDMEVNLPVNGEYLLAVRGTSAFTDTVSYSFEIITPEIITESLPFNTLISDRIGEKGEQDIYTFSGVAGQQLIYDVLSSDYLNLRLYDPAGREFYNSDARSDIYRDQANRELTLSTTGTYQLILDGYGEGTGNYQFRLIDSSTSSAALDTPITSTLESQGVHAYQLQLSERTYLYIDGQGGAAGNDWNIYGAAGQYITGNQISADLERWFDPGFYTLMLRNFANTSDRAYSIQLITPDVATPQALPFDSVVEGSISEKGEQDVYTFTGVVGQQLFYDSLNSTDAFTVTLYDPAGRVASSFDSRFDRAPNEGLTLSVDGTYRLVIDGSGETRGDYKFRLLDEAGAIPVSFDTNIVGTLVNGNTSVDSYQFTLSDRTYLYIDGELGRNQWRLHDQVGQFVANQPTNADRELWLDSGQYWLVIQGTGFDDPYQVQLITPEVAITEPITLGATVEGEIAEKGSQNIYTFAGTVGQQLFFDALGSDGGLTYSLLTPQGTLLVNSADPNLDRSFASGLILLTDGTYSLQVEGTGASTGSYKFRLLNRDAAQTAPLDSVIRGTFTENPNSTELYQFTLAERQYLYFDAQGSSTAPPSAGWLLYSPNGQQLETARLWEDRELWLNPGEYVLAMQGYGPGFDDSYQFEIVTPDVQTQTALALGTAITSTLAEKGEQDIYTFTGVAGQRLYLDILNPSGVYTDRLSLKDPTGFEVLGRWTWDEDPDPLALAMSGLYTLTVDNTGEGTPSYSFNLLDLASAVDITDDIATATERSGTLEPGRSTQFYQFSGRTGQVLQFVPLMAPASSNWTLYNSSNQVVMNAGASASPTVTLANTDTYTLAIRGYHTEPANYVFQVNELAAGVATSPPGTAINFNQVVEGTITTAGGNHNYTFTATAGQQLFYDALGGNALLKSLYDPSGRQILPGGVLDSRSDVGPNNGLALTLSGTYTLTLGGGSTGTYKFQLLDLNNAPIANFDQDLAGTLAQGALGSQAFRFAVPGRQYLYFDGLAGNATWNLFGANGRSVSSASLSQDQALWLDSGDYSLVIQGQNSATNYGIRLITSDLPTTDITAAISAGSDISGVIVDKGDTHSFTFTGTAGQQFFYDALGGDYFHIDLYDPTGRILIDNADSRFDRSPNQGFTLGVDGTYTLTMNGVNSNINTGSYHFRLLDLTNAPVASLDTTLTGSFDNGAQSSAAYRFSLSDRQYLYFDAQQGDGFWLVYGPNGQNLTSNRLFGDQELELEPGDYSLVFQGIGSNPNYGLSVITPTLPESPMLLGTNTTPNAITGALLEKGEQDTYTFDGTIGQRLLLDVLSPSGFVTISFIVYSPTGRSVYSRWLSDDDPTNILTLSETGSYRVVLDGNGEATDSYNFSLMDVTQAEEIALDTDIAGILNPGRELHVYRFTGTSGQRLYLDAAPGTSNVTWTLYNAANQSLGGNSLSDFEVTLPQDGTYALVLRGYSDIPQSYNFNLITPETIVRPAQVGTNGTPNVIADITTEKGEVHIYTLDLTAGQRLFLDVLDWGSSNRTITLDSPSGERYLSRNILANEVEISPIKLKETGTYRLSVPATGADPERYSFTLMDMNQAQLINLDEAVTGTIDPGQEAQFYRFNATAGQRLYLDSSPGTSNLYWRVYNQANQQLVENWFGNDFKITVPQDGEYTIVLQGRDNTPDNYQFRLSDVTPLSQPYFLGQVVTSQITEKGEQDIYTFAGQAGRRLFFDALTNLSGFSASLIAPSGKPVISGQNLSVNRSNIILDEDGIYQWVIDGAGETTGDYSFRLLEYANATGVSASQATPIPSNTEVVGSFDDALGLRSDFYRFTSTGNQRLYIHNIANANFWTLYAPNGELLGGYANQDQESWLASAGEYTLELVGTGAPAGNRQYQFRLSLSDEVATAYALGTTVSGTIANPGARDIYEFKGQVGQLLLWDALSGSSTIRGQLYSPSGVLLADNATTSDGLPVVLAETGSYRLVLDGVGRNTGSYSLNLVARNELPTLPLQIPIVSSLNPGNASHFYRFDGKAGQKLTFDLQAATWAGANWVLYDPSGKAIATPSFNNPDFSAALAATGTYTLAIAGTSSSPVSHNFTVTDTTPAPVVKSGFNQVQSGSFTAGQVATQTFTASAGTVLIYDGMNAPNHRVVMSLLNPDGTAIFNFRQAHVDQEPVILQQTGTYTLQFRDSQNNAAGTYSYQLLDLPQTLGTGANYLEIGSPVTGTLANRQDKIYSFQALPGMAVLFNGMVGHNFNAILYDANGNRVTNLDNFRSFDTGLQTLIRGDLYHLRIQSALATSQDYSFQLLETATAPSIPNNLPVGGTLSNGQLGTIYTLPAEKGQTFFFDNLAYSSTWPNTSEHRWMLYGPNNQALVNQELRRDFQVVAPETGEYRLYIHGTSAPNPIDYRFRMLVHDPIVGADVIIPSTGEASSSTGTAPGEVAVTLAAVDDQGAAATQSYTIRLWPDPENGSPTIVSSPPTRFALDDQIYRYPVQALDPDQDPLTYRLVDAPLGALIQRDTGEIFWFPESTVTPGTQVNFTVEVNDHRGGSDTQTFGVDVYSSLGTLQGAVFDDLNGNGFLDSKLIRGENPAVILALDVSGSTAAPFYGEGEYADIKTVLDAQRAAALTLIDSLVARGAGNTVQIGLIPHEFNATIEDMDPWTPGLQPYTTALADSNNNGIADIREILQSPTYTLPRGNNRLIEAINQIDALVAGYSGTPNLIFMSDGYSRDTPAELAIASTQLNQSISDRSGNITAFAIGNASTRTTLQHIDPTAIQLTDINELVTIFQGLDDRYVIEPFLEGVTVYLDQNNNSSLDNGEPLQITRQPDAEADFYYYRFDNLLPGTYQVRTVVPNGYTLTAPVSGVFTHTLTAAGETYSQLPGISQIATPPNADPVFVTEPAALTTLKGGDRFRYEGRAIDADADLLTYDLVLAPNGLTVDPEQGSVVWNPTVQQVEAYYAELRATQERLRAIGREASAPTSVTFQAILRAQDGQGGQALQTINLELLPDNRAPLFTSTFPAIALPQVGKIFQYQATATDPDGDALTYSLVNAPTGVTIAPTTGALSWTPTTDQLGEQRFQIKASDAKGGEALQWVNATVIQPLPNQLPVITSSPRTTTRLETPYFYEVLATDPDGDALSYSLVEAPTGMSIQGNILSWLPGVTQSGSNPVVLRVTDSQGGAVNQSFTVNVSHQAVNNAPAITSAPSFLTNLDRQYQYNLTGSDPDGDLLAWGLDQAPEGMTIDPKTGALRWQPTVSQIGDHTIAVRLSDHTGLFTVQEYDLTVRGANTPPQIVSVPITQAAVQKAYQYQVVATDPEGDDLTYSLVSRPTGMTIDSLTGLITWTPSSPSPVTVEVQARDSQGAVSSQRYNLAVGTTAINRAPSITSIPGLVADTNGSYTYQVQATDPDNDPLTYGLDATSLALGMTINPTTGLITWTPPSSLPSPSSHAVIVTASDGINTAAQGYQLVARANQVPLVRSTNPPTAATVGVEYRYDLIASDPDGGSLTYQLDQASLAKGMTLDGLGRLRWTPTAAQIGNHPVTLSLTDAAGAEVQQAFTLAVQADAVAPQVQLQFAGTDPAELGSQITFLAQSTDNVGVANLQLLVDGQPVALNAQGRATVTMNRVGSIPVRAIATDAGGNVTESTLTLQVFDPTQLNAPVVALNLSNVTDKLITSFTDLYGTVTDPDSNLDYYVLEVAPIEGGDWREIVRVEDQEVTANKLGKFDPTIIDDGSYRVRLRAVDTSGLESFVEDVLDVATGDLKLGNFTLSFTDLTLPGTVPISVTRTYDSLTANNTGDFGQGWRLEFRDVDLRTNLPKDESYEEFGIRSVGYTDTTRLFITLPGGKREVFEFEPVPVEELASLGFTRFVVPAFRPVSNTTSTLEVTGINNALLLSSTGEYLSPAGVPYNLADSYFGSQLLLTTKDGTEYTINPVTGQIDKIETGVAYRRNRITGEKMNKIASGETLTLTDSAITSSSGTQITFQRDAQGRIVGVTDMMGQTVRYQYDAAGDLVAVTDREENTTQFRYNTPNRPHFLTEIIDPLGRTGVKSEYDNQGRLTRLIDAAGNPVQMVYDPDNFLQTVTDALGHPTTYVYDTRGNVIQEVDALGGITLRAYDERNNLLSETDPLGRTNTYSYDAQDNQINKTDALGNTTTYTYNAFGEILNRINPLGNVTTYSYSPNNNRLTLTNPLGHTVTYGYTANNQPNNLTTPDGATTSFTYDTLGRVIQQIDALSRTTAYTYDANGNQRSETKTVTVEGVLQTLTTTWEYDKNNNVTLVTDPLGHITRMEYDSLNQLTASIDALGRRTEYYYDAKGQLIETRYADGSRETTTYDALGRETTTTDPLGHTTRLVYDAVGRLIETILPDHTPNDLSDNPRTKTLYDLAGQITAQIDERGNRTEFVYDLAGRRIQTKDALNHQTTFAYDKAGYRIAETDARGNTTRYAYDSVGRPSQTLFADGTSTLTEYNNRGLRSSFTDQAGNTTYYLYNLLNQPIEVIYPDNTPTDLSDNPRIRSEYDELGRVIAQIDENGNRQEMVYDQAGRLIEERSDCACRRMTYTYNALGQVLTQTDQLGNTTTFTYDILNRPFQTIFADGTLTQNIYDVVGQLIGKTDQNGNTTRYEYDPQGRLTAVLDALNQQTEYGYDLAGNLIAITDANNHVTQHEYDALNRRNATILPMGQRSSMTYDPVGNLATATDFNGDTIVYEYDVINRLSAKRFPDATATLYSYSPTGQMQTVQDQRGLTSYDYDARQRLTERIDPDGQFIRYAYDLAGNRTAVITPYGTTNYSYNKYNELQTVTDPNGGLTHYSYDQAGNLVRTAFANGVVETREYDQLNRLRFLENRNGADVISNYRYTLDAVGNRLSVTEQDGRSVNYAYDPLYRLLQEQITDAVNGNRTTGYTYDPVGNRLSRNDSATGLTTYLYDNNDRLLSEITGGDSTNYSYDNNGNTLSKVDATSQTLYDWDYENRLIGTTVTTLAGMTDSQYQYNADGIRVAQSVDGVETRYLVDTNQPHAQVIEEYAPDGTLQAFYVYGNDLISQERSGVQSFFLVDGLGSTRLLTDSTGNVTDTYDYNAYGTLIASTGVTENSYRFAGEQFDSNLGQYYLRARYYNPSTGRFTARDPFEGVFGEPLSLAKYPYVHGNPVNAVDPSGMTSLIEVSSVQSQKNSLQSSQTPLWMQRLEKTFVDLARATANIFGQALEVTIEASIEVNEALEIVTRTFDIPAIIWGVDIPVTTFHTTAAISGFGFTMNNPFQVPPSPVTPVPVFLNRATRIEGAWYNQFEPCASGRFPGDFCDEYPFGSTSQGGPDKYSAGLVSLLPVPGREQSIRENDSQGTRLGQFYRKAHVNRGPRSPEYIIPSSRFISFVSPGFTTYWINRDGESQQF